MTIPNQAWQFTKQAMPLVLSEKSVPALQANQLLIENHFAGVNPVDWKFVDYNPMNWPVGQVPGVDGVGKVIAVADDVDPAWIGKMVVYHCALSNDGSFGSHTVLFADRVMLLPEGFDPALAAALPCPLLTAWQAFCKIPVRAGQRVLLTGMGAVNKLLAQMLVDAGFSVDVISKSLTKDGAVELGVSNVYRELPDFNHYYAIFDSNGEASAKALVPYLRANGHIICILGRIETAIDRAFTRTISYHEIALGALHNFGDQAQWRLLMEDGQSLLNQIKAGKLLVEPPTVFEFEELNKALEFSKHQQRKAVVKIRSE